MPLLEAGRTRHMTDTPLNPPPRGAYAPLLEGDLGVCSFFRLAF